MEKNILLFFMIMALTSFSAITTFAEVVTETTVETERVKGTKKTQNEGRSKYLEEANNIKEQIDEIQKEINTYKDYNKSVKEKYDTLSKSYKENRTSSISKENFEKAKKLRKSIANKSEKDTAETTDDVKKNQVKNLVNEGNYDVAISKLNEILTNKKAQLEFHKNANAVYKQIAELLK